MTYAVRLAHAGSKAEVQLQVAALGALDQREKVLRPRIRFAEHGPGIAGTSHQGFTAKEERDEFLSRRLAKVLPEVVREMLIDREVEQQYVDPRLAEKSEFATLDHP